MKFVSFLLLIFFNIVSCSSAENLQQKKSGSNSSEILKNRKPAVSGTFYPATEKELSDTVNELFSKAKNKFKDDVLALIVPHAGYIYSGKTAAAAYNQLDPDKEYQNIFILCSSHTEHFQGAAIYNAGNFITPIGTIEVNLDLCNKLLLENKCFNNLISPHISEHSIETQLPFLQIKLKKKFKIIPISIGEQSYQLCRDIANALEPYFNSDNLFIISSDFSHYPKSDEAVKIDSFTAQSILSNNSKTFIDSISGIKAREYQIQNLATQACGASSILSLLLITEKYNEIKVNLIDYSNSSEISKDYNRVVGYNAIAFSAKIKNNIIDKEKTMNVDEGKKDDSLISDAGKKLLLKLARETIMNEIAKSPKPDLTEIKNLPDLNIHSGAFVTLHKNGQLRGCIGRFMADQPLYKTIIEMAIASSTQDYRFNPVSSSEIKDLNIEISVLSPLKKIKSIDEFVLGKHGIYIKKGGRSGTFLPQVATETGWSKEEFLGQCAASKAGIGWEGWKDKDTELFIYSAEIFHE